VASRGAYFTYLLRPALVLLNPLSKGAGAADAVGAMAIGVTSSVVATVVAKSDVIRRAEWPRRLSVDRAVRAWEAMRCSIMATKVANICRQ
jgi:uncharacterized protein (DUF2384 family)